MYFVLSILTTVAYGNIHPVNPVEVIFTIFIMFAGTVTFGFIISEVLSIFKSINGIGNVLYEKKMRDFQRFMRDKNINDDLKK
jgi:hypothetical protein